MRTCLRDTGLYHQKDVQPATARMNMVPKRMKFFLKGLFQHWDRSILYVKIARPTVKATTIPTVSVKWNASPQKMFDASSVSVNEVCKC